MILLAVASLCFFVSGGLIAEALRRPSPTINAHNQSITNFSNAMKEVSRKLNKNEFYTPNELRKDSPPDSKI